MKFGKTELKPEQIDFNLPELKLLPFANDNSPCRVFVGQPVWSAKGNIGKIYPKGTKANQYLHYYSRAFSSIELNATYYKIPSINQIKNWKSQTPKDFMFCPKFPQFISHRKNLVEKHEAIDEFLTNVFHFEEQLGIIFLQLPPYFGIESIKELKSFIDILPIDLKFAIEFRNESWFNNEDKLLNILNYMNERGISTVITDTPGRRDVLHMRLSNENVMIRFKGNNLHSSDFTRIDEWANSVIQMIEKGTKDIYFFFHQEDESLGTVLAQEFLNKINRKINTTYKTPQFIDNQTLLF